MTGKVISNFSGIVPKINKRELPENAAQTAQNSKLWRATLEPFKNHRAYNTPTKAGTITSIFRWSTTPGEDEYGTITTTDNLNPVVVYATNTLNAGDRVSIYDVATMTQINDQTHAVESVSGSQFSLTGVNGTAWTDGTGGYYVKENGYWFHWTADVDVVRAPITQESVDMVCWTGETEPRMTYSPIAVTGGTDYPESHYILGVPAPAAAPSLALGAGGGCDSSLEFSRSYVYTYVSGSGEEGPPTGATTLDGICPSQTVDLSGMSTGPAGNYNITFKNIYRTLTGDNGVTKYYFVAQIPVANTTYSDSISDANLGAELASASYDPPPSDLHSLKELPNGMLIGISKNEICFSEPYKPHAWPFKYRIAMNFQGVGVAVFGQSAIIGTEGQPYLVTGTSPLYMTKSKLEDEQACVSKRSMCSLEGVGAIYASPDGLVVVSHGGAEVATAGIMDRTDWNDLYTPSSITGVVHEGRYYGFYTTGGTSAGFIFDYRNGIWCDINLYATAVHVDPLSDSLFLQIGNDVVKWEDASTNLTYTWKSKVFEAPSLATMQAGQIIAESYANLTMKLYVDGSLKHTKIVENNKPFRMPGGYQGRDFEVEVVGTDVVNKIAVAETISELGHV